jgi:hypothetical protein
MQAATSLCFWTRRPVACDREDTAGARNGTGSEEGTTASLPVLRVGLSSSSAISPQKLSSDMMTHATPCVSFVKIRHL